MQTKETIEKKSKKLSRQVGTVFSSWSIYEELLGQYKNFSRPRVIANRLGFHSGRKTIIMPFKNNVEN